MQRSRYSDERAGGMWCWEATAEAGSNLSLCIAVEWKITICYDTEELCWCQQKETRFTSIFTYSQYSRSRPIDATKRCNDHLCLPLWGPSSQRHCGVCKRRAAASVPGYMRSVGISGRVTPCWSAGAGFSWAADAAQSWFCGMHWLTLWVCFVHSGAPSDKTKHTIWTQVQNMNVHYTDYIKAH